MFENKKSLLFKHKQLSKSPEKSKHQSSQVLNKFNSFLSNENS